MYKRPGVSIVVPVYNEEFRIKLVLESLILAFEDVLKEIVVIDDSSTDETSKILQRFALGNKLCSVHRNSSNLGHGPSVIKGLKLALDNEAEYVLTYDGDGFIDPFGLRNGIANALNNERRVVEFVRMGRSDPVYRRLVTSSLRFAVFVTTRRRASDPNTPSRLIPSPILREFLTATAELNLVPNLWFSIFSRLKKLEISEVKVKVEIEPQLNVRNSWNSKLRIIPSHRFILFCIKALQFWKWKI